MSLTNRQRCLRNLLLVGWTLVEGAPANPGSPPRFFMDHATLRQIPPGFEWIEYKTVNGLYRRGLLVQCNEPGQRTRWRIK